MTNNHEIKSGMALSVCTQKPGTGGSGKAAEASKRFFQAASMLPRDKALQFQLHFDKDNEEIRAYVFSDEAGITAEDYDWIFQSCRGDSAGNLREEDVELKDRKVYEIVPDQEDTSVGKEGSSLNDDFGGFDIDEDWLDPDGFPSAYYKDLLEMLYGASADMRIVTKGKDTGLRIALSGEMSLRMQTLLNLVFPETRARLIDSPQSSSKEKAAGSRLLMKDALKHALIFLMEDKEKRMKKEAGGTDEPGRPDAAGPADPANAKKTPSDPDSTSIDELELSVRSYNCLMRAGITTIGILQATDDEDLRWIRNLGRKCYEEVKQRLKEYEERTGSSKKPELTSISYSAMLDEMIGLADVKEQVRKIAAFARMKKDMAANGSADVPVVLNMEFVGNPGTAKTTVARILAGILHETGILASDELIEVGRSDLVAEYVGQTAVKVKDVFRRAKGKLLFIDEAYSLVDAWEDSYGDEAIDTIVQEMENNREDTIVIFAGYPKEMSDFFLKNPGLKSRVPFHIGFKDYSADELKQIAMLEAAKRGFEISKDAQERLLHVCEAAAGVPEYGNGRFCRNLVENAILNYAGRCYGAEGKQDAKDCTLRSGDLTLTEEKQPEKRQNPIGFRAEHQKLEGCPEAL